MKKIIIRFFIEGEVINNQQNFDINKLKPILGDLLSTIETEKIDFNSINIFSFNVNKKLKLNDLKLETNLNLKNFKIVKNPSKFKNLFYPIIQNKLNLKIIRLKLN